MMQPNPKKGKAEDRIRLADDVAAFLAAGGEITEHDHTSNKAWLDRELPKRIGGHGAPPGMQQTVIAPHARRGAGPKHQWRLQTALASTGATV
jgi:hypothetical protein